jgi:hypothetical protein
MKALTAHTFVDWVGQMAFRHICYQARVAYAMPPVLPVLPGQLQVVVDH